MAEKRKREKLGRRIKNWVLDRDYVFLCLFFAVVLGGAVSYLMSRETKPIDNLGIVFSKDSGFYDSDIEIELSKDGGDEKIVYALNAEGLDKVGQVYNTPIRFNIPEEGYELHTLIAARCDNNMTCGEQTVKTYVLGKNVNEDVDLDIINIVTPEENLYDYEKGILVPGKIYDEYPRDNPLDFIPGNFSYHTDEWIRDSNITMISTTGEEVFNKKLGIQVSGGTSVRMSVKSLKMIGNKKYGYDLVPFDYGDGLQYYNSLRLRSGSQDQLTGNVRSAVIGRLMEESNFNGGTKTKRVTVFLNDKFYGIFDVQQNYSDSFIAEKFGLGDSERILKYKGNEMRLLDETGLMNLFKRDLNVEDNRVALEEAIDMDNYLLYYALEILWNNTDWPMNSFEMWRYDRGGSEPTNEFEDGRYRFLVYDTDLTWFTKGNPEYFPGAIGDIFAFLMEGTYRGEGSSFKMAMASGYYRKKFVEILRSLMSGPFETNNVLGLVDEEASKIDRQMQLFYSDDEYTAWQENIGLLRFAVGQRNGMLKSNVKKFFGVTL